MRHYLRFVSAKRLHMNMSMRAAHCALLIVLMACHGPALPLIPGKGGPPWFEIQSEHFTLWTDASASRGRRLIREMEHLRQIVLGLGFGSGPSYIRSFVIALRDREEVGAFLGSQSIAHSWSNVGVIRQPVILLPADTDDTDRYLITRRLTHVISSSVIRNQPWWFGVGLREFFASIHSDPDKETGDFGIPLDYIVESLRKHPPTPASRMFACKTNACVDDMFYPTAWAFFAYLAHVRQADLLRYADRLNQVPSKSLQQAWTEVFPDLTPKKFDSEVRKWLAYGKHTVWHFNLQRQECPVTEQKLGDGDVLAARALLRFLLAPEPAQVSSELQESLKVDPKNALANILFSTIKKTLSIGAARRMATEHAGDWRGWWLIYYSLNGYPLNGTGTESAEAREKTSQMMVTEHADPPRLFCTPKRRLKISSNSFP